MECVADTSAISRLEKVGYLDLLSKIYERVYAPPRVFEELKPHKPTVEFVENVLIPVTFRSDKDRRRFDSLVRRWSKKVDSADIADIEVFVAYKFFTDADEALYANKGAQNKFSSYGKIRDIYELYELAEESKIFTREESVRFLESFLRLEKPYRPGLIKSLLEDLMRS